MNSLGFIRGYMARHMGAEEFLRIVLDTIKKEFIWEVDFRKELNYDEEAYVINIDNKYEMKLNADSLNELIEKVPYTVDRYIYEKLIDQGVKIDKKRSQYIKYCFRREA